MAQATLERTVRLSVLDRLMGASREPADGVTDWRTSVDRYKRAVLRDLEWLLNTRRVIHGAPESLVEVRQSVYHFGLADITSMSGDSVSANRDLARHVEQVIELFEPRLADVRISLSEGDGAERKIRFVIEALLRMDPSPERVMFDTILEVTSGKFEVTGRGHA